MRIAIIAHALHAGGGISVGRNLIASVCNVAPQHEYLISIPTGLKYEDSVGPRPQLVPFSGTSNLLKRLRFAHLQLAPALRRFEPDLIIGLANSAVPGFDCPQAILCHRPHLWYPKANHGPRSGIGPLKSALRNTLQSALLRRALRKPRNVLLYQTETARARLAQSYDIRCRTIHCPNAVSRHSLAASGNRETPDAMKRYADRFKLFYLTRYYPHKNIEILIDLFLGHREELRNAVVFVTIDPNQHPGAKKVIESIQRHRLEDCIVNVGPLPQEVLKNWFQGSDALLMPTLMESFSGAYLEAFHYGTPVLTSDLDFAREICGDAALFFDPTNTASICSAILTLQRDPQLAAQLRVKGQERLAQMEASWDQIAANLLDRLIPMAADECTPAPRPVQARRLS